MILSKILLLLSLFNPSDSVDQREIAPVQQPTSSEVVITDSLIAKNGFLDLGTLKGWKFTSQDNPIFSSPDYDDSHWYLLEKPPVETYKLPDSLWQGFGWLRLRIRLDSLFSNTLNLIYPVLMGASELYINDSLVMSHGVPGVTAGEQKLLGNALDLMHHFEFLPGKTYQLAVRYSLHNLEAIKHLTLGNIRTPFLLSVVAFNYESFGAVINDHIMFTSMISFASTILLLVVLLHLFMYLYVSEKKVNYAILILSASLFLLSVTILFQSFNIHNFWLNIILVTSATPILVMVTGGLFPLVTYQVLGIPVPLFWKRFIFVPLFLLLFFALFPDFNSDQLQFLIGLPFIYIPAIAGSILAIVKARKMKRRNIGIVAGSLLVYPFGFFILVAGSAIFTISYYLGYIFNLILIVMLISMPLGMSIQQAKIFLQLHLKLDFLVKERTTELSKSLNELKSTQTQLIQSEKMASLGQLTAGIAHEIQNPLNFVNNFSEISNELIDELNEEMDKGDIQEAKAISGDIKQNLEKINHHGKRAESIVKGMLLHSRGNSGQKEPTDINALCDEYLRLSYHGFRAKDKSFNAEYKTDFDPNLPKINVVPQDIGRVLLNLINNAFYAVDKRVKEMTPLNPSKGGTASPEEKYKPTVTVRTAFWNPPSADGGRGALISVSDNGPGIPDSIKDKIFQPFFTTKPTGQGTGLGLSLAYDIVKAHGGEIKVNTKSTRSGADGENEGLPGEQTGTEFTIILPA